MVDGARALALAAALGAAWAARDWAALSQLRLPDTDDTMRLVQVRDLLAGQSWHDLTQYRLAGGLPMHWTRAADLGPAALILGLSLLFDVHGVEVAAVVVWPLILFAVGILLVQRLARAAGASAGVAALIAALAYPATTIFAPGRIDHHGLQVVLLLGAVLAVVSPATLTRGLAIGATIALSLVVGLETAPLLALVGAVAVGEWITHAPGSRFRLLGLGLGAGATLVLARVIFASEGWDNSLCDGFTAEAWRAALASAGLATALATLPKRLALHARLLAVAIGGAALIAWVVAVTPHCLSPYGGVDPLLRRVWLSKVGEAQSIASAPLAAVIAYLGLAAAGLAVGGWRLRRKPDRATAILFALQVAAFALACIQLRGAYAAALLAVPALASVIETARRAGVAPLAVAWTASAGILYPMAAQAAASASAPASAPAPGGSPTSCEPPAELARLPAGLVMAPIDLGPRILLDTPHSVVSAPYHRNNAGNRASYLFFSGDPERAGRIAAELGVDYVVLCPSFAGAGAMPVHAEALPVANGQALLFRLSHPFSFKEPTAP